LVKKIFGILLFSTLTTTSAFPGYTQQLSPTKENRELFCLAENIYHEARNQSVAGKIAVSLVVLNRVSDRRWPNTICEVTHQGPTYESWKTKKDKSLPKDDRVYYPIRNKCQFSWWCDGLEEKIDFSSFQWQLSLQTAEKVLLTKKFSGMVEGANHYHADSVSPSWRIKMTLITKIDNHLFYRQD
jgi:N-acetylmuramoyl-L-alanine amidase